MSVCQACKDTTNLKCVTCGKSVTATPSVDASELAKEIDRAIKHAAYADGTVIVDTGFLERCLSALPSNESVSKKEAQLLVSALQEFHTLSDIGGDIEDHEVGEIYTRLLKTALERS